MESPAKARTIAGYLGKDFAVESSIGHIRDLPDRASDVPAAERKRFGALGVDVDNGFEPYYVVDAKKKKVVTDLKKHLKDADELLLATDEDREGEAIAWHLVEVLKPKVPVRRMVFHEITREAIGRALEDTRVIDQRLVDAQETRRILDRLYGYEVSPVLWKKVTRGLSAGRVQSVATRLVVQRERERIAFVSADYWDIAATFDPGSFDARLVSVDGRRVAQGRDFAAGRDPSRGRSSSGSTRPELAGSRNVSRMRRSASGRRRRSRIVAARQRRFRTATLQQEASRKLRFSAQTTMRVAQRLYESGHITYMRTDSTTLSESALAAARAQVRELFGDDYVPEKPRAYGRAVANAQEAHEAIRPAGDTFRTPDDLKRELSRDEHALYDLVWKRTLASQMEDARGQTVSLRIGASSSQDEDVEFAASGTVLTFRGFLAAYEPGRDEPSEDDEERRLPQLEPRGRTSRPRARARGPLDEPAAALYGADPRQGARGSWHRPPVDLRRDPLDDPRSRIRVQEGHRARPDLPRVRGREPARTPFPAARRLRLHGPDGGRPRPDRVRGRGAGRVAGAVLLRRRGRAGPASPGHRASGRDRRTRGELDRDSGNRRGGAGSDATARISSSASRARASRPTSPRTS